jgi:hypothetical protein
MYKIVFTILLFTCHSLFAQNLVTKKTQIISNYKKPARPVVKQSVILITQPKLAQKTIAFNSYKPVLGWFCYREIEIQKALKLPLFIRLGSKAYVDYLEGK